MTLQEELLESLVLLQKEIRSHHKMNIKKDYSLMIAVEYASSVIAKVLATRDDKKLVTKSNEDKTTLRSETEEWPNGATVKLEWPGYGPYEKVTGWAKRDENGVLVTAFGLKPLDESKWKVMEERSR